MLSSVYSIGPDIQTQNWNLHENLGNGFEKFIYNYLCDELSSYFKLGSRIYQTSATRDDGKDIIIKSSVDILDFIGHSFFKKGKDSITIYIECKSSNNRKISYDKIIGNVEKITDNDVDYFVLITNSTITPYTHYKISNVLKNNDIEFILVDQYYLAQLLYNNKKHIGDKIRVPQLPKIYSEYQVLSGYENGEKIYNIFILVKSYVNTDQLVSIDLITDRNWDIFNGDLSFVLSGNTCMTKKLTITRAYSDGINDIILKIILGENESQIKIKGYDYDIKFEPEFIGRNHKKCLDEFYEALTSTNLLQIKYIWGDAGIGKTRIVFELYKRLNGRNLDFGFFVIEKDYDYNETISKIKSFLINKEYLELNDESTSLTQCISKCKHEYRRAIIFIDDCHNGNKKLYNDIKNVNLYQNNPISIILCGRNDFTAGDLNYYSFIKWCESNNDIIGNTLTPFEQKETEYMIRSIINDVPQIVLNKICSLSQNNPLFIIQFIEYLLELNVVSVINRNTVGILNPDTFCNKVYIPNAVHEIYENRINNLLKTVNGNYCLYFLYILSALGGYLSSEDALLIFEEYDVINNLIERRLIKSDMDGNIRFIHESFYLYVERRLSNDKTAMRDISQLIFENYDYLLYDSNNMLIGKLAFWMNDFDKAKKMFSTVVREIKIINNVSSYNVDISIFNYLPCIYDIYKLSNEVRLLQNIILVQIYISLHYFAPTKAIVECDNALSLIKETPSLKTNKKLKNDILEQKAHSLFNAGKLIEGELIMKELQAFLIIDRNQFQNSTVFDMYDRLCGLYIKYNCFNLAKTYNDLSFREARKQNDNKLLVIANLTKNKLYLYKNKIVTEKCLNYLDEALKDGSSDRIKCSSNISRLVFEILYKSPSWDYVLNQSFKYLKEALNKNYLSSIIRSYLLIATSYLLLSKTEYELKEAQKFIYKGIDSCIKFGNSVHIWQFYNLLAIINMNLNYDADSIKRIFETVFTLLSKQNLLYLGNRNNCYGNIFAISNYGFFLQSNGFETEFYRKMSKIYFGYISNECDYNCGNPKCGFVCYHTKNKLKEEFQKAKNKKLLFSNQTNLICLRDPKTNYFIIIS